MDTTHSDSSIHRPELVDLTLTPTRGENGAVAVTFEIQRRKGTGRSRVVITRERPAMVGWDDEDVGPIEIHVALGQQD